MHLCAILYNSYDIKKNFMSISKEEDRGNEQQGFLHIMESVVSTARGIFHALTEHVMEPFHNTIHSALRHVTDTLITAATLLFGTALIAVGFAKLLDMLLGLPGVGFVIIGMIVLVFGVLLRIMRTRT